MTKNNNQQDIYCTNKEFGLRLAMLRERHQLSARQMSLNMGQNKNYITSIESGKNFPSMKNFFGICDYLNVTPGGFFGFEKSPIVLNEEVMDLILQLPPNARNHLYIMLTDLMSKDHFPFL
ncbi:MAG: helix-turn-helix transcriptional regulator [Lachnospiraceae bacterium]|nr:helix-turn-helix transcriptional regulator [Lachnospiraceae bacterium]